MHLVQRIQNRGLDQARIPSGVLENTDSSKCALLTFRTILWTPKRPYPFERKHNSLHMFFGSQALEFFLEANGIQTLWISDK